MPDQTQIDTAKNVLLQDFGSEPASWTTDHLDSDALIDASAKISALLREGPKDNLVVAALTALEFCMFDVIDAGLKPEVKAQLKEPKLRHKNIGMSVAEGAFAPKGSEARTSFDGMARPFLQDGSDPYRKLLQTVLSDCERNIHYPADEGNFHPKLYYVGLVQKDDFLGNIARGYHWKDVGTSARHGEYTHRLQWYVIARSGLLPIESVGKAYRAIGSSAAVSKTLDVFKQNVLWARLFDRPGTGKGNHAAESDLDFRCPEQLTNYLMSPPAIRQWPILCSFISARFQKRTAQNSFEPDAFPSQVNKDIMRQYTARKLHGKSYSELTQVEKDDVAQRASFIKPSNPV